MTISTVNGVSSPSGVSGQYKVSAYPGVSYQSSSAPSWPSGTDGALLITTGNTVNLAAGSVKNYSSITIQSGAVLNITGTPSAVTIIGCLGNFNNQGTIQGIDNGDWGQPLSYSATAPDGQVISYPPISGNAYIGGDNGNLSGNPGAAAYGNGGAGVGNSNPASATNTAGGSGTAGTNGAAGGAGAAVYGNTGGNGGDDLTPTGLTVGGGGGGGSRGQNGQVVYFNVYGNIVNTGTINFSGAFGGSGGGAGATSLSNTLGAGGGGGSGGAGGFGGLVKFRVHGSGSSMLVAAINVTGAAGGNSGSGGQGYEGQGEDGSTGDNGANGVISVSTY